ncbi:hypothetical protein LAZ67_17002062 [Cordylochernes scorpioides]|uniref:ATP-dependent DNA helicase n=1 Tax=Cordylochernes scorpioides TaxID=51811 RepID=A0ABY6LGK4_9ARAC|nr:hypothetical protein LAZ67_17002062 [Cordylochernes scorpioides]
MGAVATLVILETNQNLVKYSKGPGGTARRCGRTSSLPPGMPSLQDKAILVNFLNCDSESATEALRAFRSFKDIRSGKGPMSCYSLKRLIKSFEETGSLEAKPRSGRPSTCKSVAVTVLQNAEAIETLSPYGEHPLISLGMMDTTCRFCGALRWKDESSGMCCSNGKVRLPLIDLPPEPLRSLLSGENSDSVHFLRNIRKYNSCFQMTSFGAENQTHSVTFPTTFSIQGQVYHRIGSLMPSENQQSRFLQIYFMGNDDDDIQTDRRCQQIQGVRRNIVQGLQRMLHQHNLLVQQFKTALENLPSDAYRVVVNADRTPPGQHPRRYNAPTANEVAVVLAGNQFGSRDIVLHQRDNLLQHVSDTHRFYDALQYPLIFWKGQEGYSFHIPQIDPNTRQPLSSKVSSMDFYGYFIMVRRNSPNVIVQFGQLFHQFLSICMRRRRAPEAGGFTAKVKIRGREEVTIDNRWVVPYSPLLSKMFCAHINVENCSSVKAIKYIYKYVNKGSDQAIINLRREGRGPDPQNEVRMYQCARYISSNEAVWRLLSFPLHQRHPAVIHLTVHLENGERIYFNQNTLAHRMRNPPRTTLTAFFSLCQTDSIARTLLYPDVPQYYTWNSSAHEWRRRVQGKLVEGQPGVKRSDTIGRVYAVHVSNFECFCLRMLLHNIKGPTSFAYMKIVNGSQYETFRETCAVLGLLENDNHWVVTMDEAVLCQAPTRVRQLFAILISTCTISNPQQLWITYRDEMASDILHRYQLLDSSIRYNDLIYNETLCNIEDRVVSICGKKVQELGLGAPRRNVVTNSDILRELAYDTAELEDNVASMLHKLLPEQRRVFDAVLAKINLSQPIILFLDAPGGTGKTFLLNILLAMIRKEQNIAIAVASSGIAATLLAGGRTAHSVLKLPLTFAEGQTAVCNIRKNSDKASLLRSCKLLVWDECTMAHKIALEALDRTLQDIRDDPQPMGGLVVLLAGDFRQTLPVVTRGTPADELNACLKSSYLWSHIVKMHLTVNMRVQLHNDTTAAQFADELLKIGEGQLETDSEGKIFESLIHIELLNHINSNNVMHPAQHGFTQEKSTISALQEITKLSLLKRETENTAIVTVDISGAFDNAWHPAILQQLDKANFPAVLIKIINSYFEDRSVEFKYTNVKCIKKINKGCPQGGIISPILRNILLNDFNLSFNESFARVIAFADDVTFVVWSSNIYDLQYNITKCLVKIKAWCEKAVLQDAEIVGLGYLPQTMRQLVVAMTTREQLFLNGILDLKLAEFPLKMILVKDAQNFKGLMKMQKITDLIKENPRTTLLELEQDTGISKTTIGRIVTEDLKLKKTPAKFIPRFLTIRQKLSRLATCENMLEMTRTDPEWKDKIITGDETWVYGYDPETKRQSAEWRGQDISPNDFFLFPKLKAVLKGRHFDTRDDIIEKSLLALKSIPKEAYKNCFDNCEKRWHWCIEDRSQVCHAVWWMWWFLVMRHSSLEPDTQPGYYGDSIGTCGVKVRNAALCNPTTIALVLETTWSHSFRIYCGVELA